MINDNLGGFVNLWVRFLLVVLRAWRAKPITILETSEVKFRTWFHDLDINLHMNNGRYLTLMDLGRMDLMIRTGLSREVLQNKWMPVVASAHMTFRRSLSPLQKFSLRTRVIGWDEKWFYIQQEFHSNHRLCARGLVKAALKGHSGTVPTAKILAMLGAEPESPVMTKLLKDLIEADKRILESLS